MCRRFCRMGKTDPDERIYLGVAGSGHMSQPAWVQYKMAMAQYLDAADAADPLRPGF